MIPEEMIKLIDERIAKYMQANNKHIVYKYAAIITGFNSKTQKYTVKLPCYNTEFLLLNKSNSTLSIGDSVFIEAIGNNFTNAYISEKFGVN